MSNHQPTSLVFERMLKNILSNGPFYTAMWAGILFTATTYLYLPAQFSSIIGGILIFSLWSYDSWRPERKLYDAIKKDDTKFLKSYLEKDKNVNFKSIEGFTMIHIACIQESIEIVDLLTKYGADVNVITIYGETPLHFAVSKVNIALVSLLIRCGAKVDLKDDEGKTPYDWAIQLNHIEIAEFFRNLGAGD